MSPKATQTEDLMNSADKSGCRPVRGKSIFHLSWIQEHCAAWDDLLWSTDPIFQEEFLQVWGPAGPGGLAWRLKNRATRIMLCTRFTVGGKRGQGELCMPDNPQNKTDWYKYLRLGSHALQCTLQSTCKNHQERFLTHIFILGLLKRDLTLWHQRI